MDVAIDKGGSNLSSGERQLLCFARALLNAGTRPILVLDEATSNLDRESDDAVQALLRSEFGGREAHRPTPPRAAAPRSARPAPHARARVAVAVTVVFEHADVDILSPA
eukprot:3233573-Prymnesium_polylepis.1